MSRPYLNLHRVICPFCYYKQCAERSLARAKEWDDQNIPCLAAPHRTSAAAFEAMAEGAKSCTCADPNCWPTYKPPRKKPVDPL